MNYNRSKLSKVTCLSLIICLTESKLIKLVEKSLLDLMEASKKWVGLTLRIGLSIMKVEITHFSMI